MRWRLLTVALLAVTAGCEGFGVAGPGGGDTVTPAPVPTVAETATPTPAPTIAPGVTTRGVRNVSALVAAHVRVARDQRWVWTETRGVSRRFRNGTASTQTVWFVGERSYRREIEGAALPLDGESQHVEGVRSYADGTDRYTTWRSPVDGERVYRRESAPAAGERLAGLVAGPLHRFFPVEDATVTRVEVGDRPHYRIVGSWTRVSHFNDATKSATVRALVREDGFVRRLHVSYTVSEPGRWVRGTYNSSYRRVGTATLDRPAWVDTAANRTGD